MATTGQTITGGQTYSTNPFNGTNFSNFSILPFNSDTIINWGQHYGNIDDPNSSPYRIYTNWAMDQFTNNPTGDFATEYTRNFHDHLREAHPDWYDADGNYVGGKTSVLNEDGTINPEGWGEARYDQKFGFVHQYQPIPTPQEPEPEPTPRPTPRDPEPVRPGNPYTPIRLPNVGASKSIWTDWIPILSKYFTNRKAARRDAEQQKKMRFPLEMAKERHAIKTDAYLQRQLLEKQKQEMLARADAIPTSNMDDKMRLLDQVHEVTEKYSDKQAQLQSAEYHQTLEDVVKAANYNTASRVDTANNNAKAIAASYNNIINANRKQIAKDAANVNATVDSLYRDYGKWKHDQRLNDVRRNKYLLQSGAEEAIAKYGEILADETNPERWHQLANFAVELTRSPEGFSDEEIAILNRNAADPVAGLQNDSSYRNLVLGRLQTGTDAVSSRWRTAWEEYKKQRQTQHDAAVSDITAEYARRRAELPTIIDNQIFDYNPGWRNSSLMYKEGGKAKAKALKEWARSTQKAKEQSDENFNEAQKRAQTELRKQLDALDKEQLVLLKAIFK